MELSSDLVAQFVKLTRDATKRKGETTLFGTVKENNGRIYVQFDGSDIFTPANTTVEVRDGERVTVMLKNHSATITGNLSSPAVRTDTIGDSLNNIPSKNDIDRLDKENTTIKKKIEDVESEVSRINDKIQVLQISVTTISNKIDLLMKVNSALKEIVKTNGSSALNAVVHFNGETISSLVSLTSVFGASAHLQWSWEKPSENTVEYLESSDSRISASGFKLTPTESDTASGLIFKYTIII